MIKGKFKRERIIASIFVLLISTCFGSSGGATDIKFRFCAAQDHKSGGGEGGLFITDFAFLFEANDCPTEEISNSSPISMEAGQPLHIWLRLQGDSIYLKTRHSREPILVKFRKYRKNAPPLTVRGVINVGVIDASAAGREALENGDVFDWRTRLWRTALLPPGEYALRLVQGGYNICILGGSSNRCEIPFNLEPRKASK